VLPVIATINQSIKFNSGCLAHKEKTHTITKKTKKERKTKLQNTTTTLPVNYSVHW